MKLCTRKAKLLNDKTVQVRPGGLLRDSWSGASLLIQKLKVYGLEEDIATWISSYLTDRYQSFWIDHVYSNFLENSRGLPQGSNLGPLLFLILCRLTIINYVAL